jgi:hypothetical protein
MVKAPVESNMPDRSRHLYQVPILAPLQVRTLPSFLRVALLYIVPNGTDRLSHDFNHTPSSISFKTKV